MSDILKLCRDLPEATFDAATVVLTEGTPAGSFYILIEGSVEISKNHVPIDTVATPGSVFGEMSVLLQRPVTASVRTIDASRFYVVEQGIEFLRSNPELNIHVSKLLAARIDGLNGYLVDIKTQFKDYEDHLGMVDEMVESLLHLQLDEESKPS